MAPHPLPNFEIQRYYQNKLEFNHVYFRINLPKIKEVAYHEHANIGNHWVDIYVKNDIATYFDSLGLNIRKHKFMGNRFH